MNYRSAGDARFYVCPGCASPEQGPPQGGAVACSKCRTAFTLPDRSGMLANPGYVAQPDNNPQRLAQLRVQDGRPRLTPPTLQSVLGGDSVQPGREQEAIAIWQSLRMRAMQGDVSASEDMALLTALIAQLPSSQQQPLLVRALAESAYDASVLPRHKQEHLGRLVRRAVMDGDRQRAQQYLAWMIPNAPELDADSEFRVSSAIVATMDRDAQRVLVLLGPQKDAIPIVDSMDPMASVVRANAHELMGNVAQASAILRELPNPQMLVMVQSSFAALQMCRQSGGSYQAATTQQAAQRAASSAGATGCLVGVILGFTGLVLAVVSLVTGLTSPGGFAGGDVVVLLGVGGPLLVVGVVLVLIARAKGKRAAWLRTNGVSLPARIVNAERTGTTINDVPLYNFVLQVAGPHGPYAASFKKLAPEHEVAMAMGREVRVRANPGKLDEVILED